MKSRSEFIWTGLAIRLGTILWAKCFGIQLWIFRSHSFLNHQPTEPPVPVLFLFLKSIHPSIYLSIHPSINQSTKIPSQNSI